MIPIQAHGQNMAINMMTPKTRFAETEIELQLEWEASNRQAM